MLIIKEMPSSNSSPALRREVADEIAADSFGCHIERKANGKPFLVNGKAEISISHTDRYLAFLGGNTPCGVDIELTNRNADRASKKFATPSELAVCAAAWSENPALLVWCVKEAIYKMQSIDGVDFIRDIRIADASHDTISAKFIPNNAAISLRWKIEENLLIVHTL